MFVKRFISAVILLAFAAIALVTGGDFLLAASAVVAIGGTYEILKVDSLHKTPLGAVSYIAAAGYYVMLYLEKQQYFTLWIVFMLILLLTSYVFSYPKYKTEQMLAVFFGVFYVAVMLSYVYQTRMLTAGAYIVWLIFLCSWGCDTCAYCVGMLIGKHKMSPKLSPKKSVEGAIGGVVGAALLTVIYGMIFKNAMGVTTQHVWIMAAISAVGALISMVGDLTASAIKRNYEIKDYGKLIPGHGGILDRFDSVIFTAPIIYFLSVLLIH